MASSTIKAIEGNSFVLSLSFLFFIPFPSPSKHESFLLHPDHIALIIEVKEKEERIKKDKERKKIFFYPSALTRQFYQFKKEEGKIERKLMAFWIVCWKRNMKVFIYFFFRHFGFRKFTFEKCVIIES